MTVFLEKIGTLPAEIDVDHIPAVLAFIEKIYNNGIERGKRLGKKGAYEHLLSCFEQYEDAKS